MLFRRAPGRERTHGRTISPIEVKPTIAGIREGRDELLEEALGQIEK